jgi:glutamate synthase domain-containing protein 2
MLDRLNAVLPLRLLAFSACVLMLLLCLGQLAMDGTLSTVQAVLLIVSAALTLVGLMDATQTKRSVLRNYPVIGHLRFMLEFIRPEIRQYFLESDTDATPFSRAQRSLVYQRAKGETDKRPFGTQLDVQATGYEWINHAMVPTALPTHDFRTVSYTHLRAHETN